ncbi:MAG: pseudouridine synthase [Buchnera aphidicola (Brevicoryne brassicae)]|uniref:Pseudouridine synthase n=1 Tax=Buchnera aphidicola (Brevicoryne brassicae) TaxID=911343 RepID=A0AAJ5PVU2_9GAMM|nr:pseudouridine synthase [Buchnera aphidicola]QCI19845.1 pseudouridine synthase [Buchnera aphidicola (Brevicoryne brassicae)]WAI19222.1 MAG: pseudouridine synthase [Buchnera aphidicola (Brevicoryne brassicae)]
MCEKIQKILSFFGHSSRREIEKMIKSENILINDKKAFIGQRFDKNKIDKITIKGEVVSIKKKEFNTKVLIYNKPEGEICTRYDFKKRPTVFDKLPILRMQRWISIGRLDLNTRGLLLFTNDGYLANELMHPRNQIEREYYIRVFGKIDKNTMNILKNGVRIKDGYASFKEIQSIDLKKSSKNQWFKGIICEGRNREIRFMWKKMKCQVSRLIRIRYGNVILPKTLKLGKYLELNSVLINKLYNLIPKKSFL